MLSTAKPLLLSPNTRVFQSARLDTGHPGSETQPGAESPPAPMPWPPNGSLITAAEHPEEEEGGGETAPAAAARRGPSVTAPIK